MPAWLLVVLAWVFGPVALLVLLDLYHRAAHRRDRAEWRDFTAWETELWT